MVALRDKQLREITADPDLTVLRLLCDRRDELSQARAQALNRMHRLFTELIPGGAPVKKSTAQYQALLASVRPRDPAGKTRRRMAAAELAGIERLDAKLKTMKAELKAAVQASGSHLMDIHGIGPAGAARILADVADVARFPNRAHFASWTAPPPSTLPAASTPTTGCRGPGTAASTTCSTWPAWHCCVGRSRMAADWSGDYASRNLGLCWLPVPARGDLDRGPLVPAVRAVLPGCRRTAG
jgi:Transposase IS116/IS110/IS902 family